MRQPVTLLIVALLATVVAGCRTAPRKDLVEAELRVKDQDLRELRSDLERTEAYNQFLQRELKATQGAVPPGVADGVSPAGVRSIVLGRQTGGIDEDGLPGDEALQVVLEPRDGDNHTIKAAGAVHIQALEVTLEGVKKPLSSWHVDPESLRKAWRTGLLSTGYFLNLPWKNWPSSTKVRVIVQFVGQDERLFEADRDVVVRLAPEAQRKTPGVEGPPFPMPSDGPSLPGLPREGDILPQPRKVEPEKKDEKELPKEQPDGPSTTPAATFDPNRPLKGAVEMLRPITHEN